MKWNLRYCLIVVYNKIVLTKTYQLCRNYVFRFRYKHLPKSYESIRNNLIEKKKNNVAFFIHDAAKWKYEGVYRCFEKDERFNPYIVIVPFAAGSVTGYNVEENMMKTYSYFKTTHKVCLPYDANSKKIFDIRGTEFEPDLIFYMNCWHECGKYKQFSYRHNWDKLQAYVPYAWMISARYIEHFNRDFHNCMWKIFYETPLHVNMSKQYAINKGINAVSSGYPMLDVFFDSNYVPNDSIWKKQGKRKKRIIWAPHHHIYEKNRCANFLFVYDLMIQLAKKYENEVQFIFRPHPELAKKLDFCVSGWNEQKRKEYYSVWENMPNTQIELGDYIDMFLTSDALIQDCGSFTAEYLATGKPMLFMEANKEVIAGWNECGKAIASHLYLSDKGAGVEDFIQNVVIAGQDSMLEQRLKFIENYIRPKSGNASLYIYEYIKQQLS